MKLNRKEVKSCINRFADVKTLEIRDKFYLDLIIEWLEYGGAIDTLTIIRLHFDAYDGIFGDIKDYQLIETQLKTLIHKKQFNKDFIKALK